MQKTRVKKLDSLHKYEKRKRKKKKKKKEPKK